MLDLAATAALVSVLFWTFSNTVSKRLSVSLNRVYMTIAVLLAGFLPIAVLLALFGAGGTSTLSLLIAAFSGVFLVAGFVLLYKALHTEQLTNTVVLGEIQPAILVVFGIFVLGEHVILANIVFMIMIFAGAVLVVTSENLRINGKLMPALLANISWTIYWIMISYSVNIGNGFVVPVAMSRVFGLAILLLYTAFFVPVSRPIGRIKRRRPSMRAMLPLFILLLILCGIADATGDTIFAYVAGSQLAIGGAISALTPVVVSVIAYFVYKERLTRTQALGFAIMVIGAIALNFV